MSLFQYVLAAVLLLPLMACTARDGDTLVYAQIKDLAGIPAVDCGRVALGESPESANACALAALEKKSAFMVRYEVQGLDSHLVVGLAADAVGKLVVVKHDTEGWDPHELRPQDKLVVENHVLIKPCDTPTQLH